ncbi:MAG TPA: formate/nitrite transporter family protein [Clostridia bacterium]|nr:formate/nitrite transporter family protein [Clostridia bacterium]
MGFLTPPEIARSMVETAKKKASLSLSNMFALAVLAGAFIAFGAEGSTMAIHDFPLVGLGKYVAGLIFGTGLMMVIVGGAELFTGNSLMTTGLLTGEVTGGRLLRNWVIVYLGNFAGALIVAFLMSGSGLWGTTDGLLGQVVVKIALGKVGMTWSQAFIRGILCNWLVCMAVWLAAASKDVTGKILGVFFPIMLFITSGFEHSIANMYYIPAGNLAARDPAISAAFPASKIDSLTWGSLFVKNLIPVTLGNIIGGALFVAGFYWFAYLRQPVVPSVRVETIKKAPTQMAAD